MPVYQVGVVRYFGVTIEAEDEEKAEELAAFFLGDCVDTSNDNEKANVNFRTHEIKMVENDSFLL